MTIYNSMEARWRKYHSIDHVFSICETSSHIQILAGLFHDVVYLQIDRRIHPKISKFLPEITVAADNYEITVPDWDNSKKGRTLFLVNELFGLKKGQKVTPAAGANEYLSALAAARVLEPLLDLWDLTQIIACIEMTIPFRKPNSDNKTPSDLLATRLESINLELNLNKNPAQILDTIKDAVEIANRDVIGFSYEDFSQFTSQTWQLILEGNPVFKNPMFTISEYRTGLFKVEKFYSILDPALIYHDCAHPNFDRKAAAEMGLRATSNLKLGREYFQAKLLTAAFLESAAMLTGGDCPIVLFIGQLSQKNVNRPIVMEDFLDRNIPEKESARANPIIVSALDDMLFDALTLGIKKEITMSSYIYSRIEQQTRLALYEKAKLLFEKKISPSEFLKEIERDLCESLINAVAQMASTRSQQLLALKKGL